MRGAVLLLALFASLARADDVALLRQALAADRTQPREGVLVLAVWPAATPVQSRVEVAADGRGHARRAHLAGLTAGLVVVTDGGTEWRRAPGSDTWQRILVAQPPGLAGGAADAARIATNYTLSSAAAESVAGRATRLLSLTPKHAGNAAHRLWLDQATGVPLRTEVRNHRGVLITRAAFETIRFGEPARAEVTLPAGARRETAVPPTGLVRATSLAELERRVGHRVLRPEWLPAGYGVAGYFARASRQGGWSPVTVLSDGLNTITVMETRGRGGAGRGRGRGGGRGQRDCWAQPSRLHVVVRLTRPAGDVVIVGDHDSGELESLGRGLN